MKLTIKIILDEIKDVVENRKVNSGEWWLAKAFELNGLLVDLKDKKLVYEINYKKEISDLLESEDKVSVSRAELKVESSSENYRLYKYLKGREKVIEEMILLAKKKYKDTY